MKTFLFKIAAVFLSLLVLISTFSFTVDKHFCGDFLVDISFVGDAIGCGMQLDAKSTKKKNCCKDEIIKIEGQDELKLTSFENISFDNQQFIIPTNYAYQSKFLEDLETNYVFKDFPPPDLKTDFQVAYQTFLI